MHRYEELEKRYYKEKAKEVVIILIGGFIVFFLLYFIYSFLSREDNQKENISQHKEQKEKIKIIQHNQVYKKEKNITKQIEHKEPKIVEKEVKKIIPVMPKIEIKEKYYPVYQNRVIPIPVLKYHIFIDKNITKKTEVKKEKNITKQNNLIKQEKPKFDLVIKEVNLSLLEKNFNNKPTFEDAILISKTYLKNGNLKKAQEWALKANELNSNSYKSWKLFALILIKKNRKEEAIKVLNTYLKEYNSDNEEIKKLLRSLE